MSGMSGVAGGVRRPSGETGEPGEPNFFRKLRFGNEVIGSGQRNRWRDCYVDISWSVSLRR